MLSLTTLRLITTVSFASFAFGIFTLWRFVPQEKSLGQWVISLACLATAMLLLSLRGIIPDFMSIAIANAMVVYGIGLSYAATRGLLGKTSPTYWHLVATLIAFSVCLISDNIATRIAVTSALYIPFLGSSAWEFFNSQEDGLIRAANRIAAALFAVGVLFFGFRAFNPPHPGGSGPFIETSHWLESLPFLYATCFSIWLSLTLMLIVSFRLKKQQEAANAAITASESRFRELFENTPVAYQSLDIEGRYLAVNQELCDMLGYRENEMLGRSFDEFWVDDLQPCFPPKFSEFKSCGTVSTELVLAKKDGGHVNVLLNGRVQYDIHGNFVRTHCVLADISEQKRVEDEIDRARQQAETLAQHKSDFLANMSHEIRTPMNGIIGLSQLALNKDTSPEVRDYLEKIASSSQSLLGILNDILDFSKIEAGRMHIDKEQFDLDQVLDNVRSLFKERAVAKNLAFNINVSKETPRDLMGDAMRIQQVLSNLIGNAIKFTSHGEVTLRVGVKQQDSHQALISFAVADTGIGLSAENLQKLFQPFSQVDSSITRKFGGTGLGLAISQNLLGLMGSQIHVESEHGQGSVFSFDVPLGLAGTGEIRAARIRRKHEAGQLEQNLRKTASDLKGARILVAEDNAINQQVVKEFLKLSGMEVDIASNGQEALDALEKKAFDAVLMDVQMPVMGGIEATQRIRQLASGADLPIIALTAGVTEEERQGVLDSGMNDLVAKPVNPEALIAALLRWVRL